MFSKLFVALLLGYVSSEDLFSYQDCGGSKLQFQNISISPLPIKLSQTSKLFVSAKVQVLEDLPTDALAELTLIKLVDVNGQKEEITIPCINGMGSCTLKVCDLFANWYNDVICPFMKGSGQECKCPVHKALLQGTNLPVDVPFSQFKGVIAWMASGEYNIRFRITDPAKTANYSCLRIHTTLDIQQSL